MPFSSRIYKSLILSFGSLLLTLSLIEIGLRIFYHYNPREFENPGYRSPEPDYWFDLVSTDGTTIATINKPGWIKFVLYPFIIYKNAPNQHNKLFNINSLGFRGEEVSRKKGDQVFRIIMLGGSSTFGAGSSCDAGTIPYQLQRKLNESHSFSKRVEVINAGVLAYISIQELVYLETELIDLSPDLIIAYDGWNDFFTTGVLTRGCRNPLENPEQIGYHGFFYEIESLLMAHSDERNAGFLSQVGALLRPLALKTSLGSLLRERSLALQQRPVRINRPDLKLPKIESQNWDSYEPDLSCVQHIVDYYQRNLAQMARFLSSYNVDLLIAVQPEIVWKKPWWSKEEIQHEQGVLKQLPWYRKAAQIIYPQLVQAAENVATEYSVPFVDLRTVFNERTETIFLDPAHTTDQGNGLVAQALSEHVFQILERNHREDLTEGSCDSPP